MDAQAKEDLEQKLRQDFSKIRQADFSDVSTTSMALALSFALEKGRYEAVRKLRPFFQGEKDSIFRAIVTGAYWEEIGDGSADRCREMRENFQDLDLPHLSGNSREILERLYDRTMDLQNSPEMKAILGEVKRMQKLHGKADPTTRASVNRAVKALNKPSSGSSGPTTP